MLLEDLTVSLSLLSYKQKIKVGTVPFSFAYTLFKPIKK